MMILESKSPSDRLEILTYLQANYPDPHSELMSVYGFLNVDRAGFGEALANSANPQATIYVQSTADTTYSVPKYAKVILVDTSSNSNTSTLPTDEIMVGKMFYVVKTHANNTITVNVDNSGTINGQSNYVLLSEHETAKFLYIGDDKFVIL
ncbi:hypothetical protein VF06_37720 [Nostoc linckia z4]|nr:hypothetical protein VF06_37720 [Nostoc linckia z4]